MDIFTLSFGVIDDDVGAIKPTLPRKFLNNSSPLNPPTMHVPPLCRLRPPWRPPAPTNSPFSVPSVRLLLRPSTPAIRAKSLRHYSSQQHQHKRSFFEKLRESWNDTKVEWYSIPVGLGIGVVAFAHLRNMRNRESQGSDHDGGDDLGSGKKIRPMGSW